MPLYNPASVGLDPQTNGGGQPGILAPSCDHSSYTAGVPTANRAYLVRVVPLVARTITKIRIMVAATGTVNTDVGIYTLAAGTYTRVVSSGSTAGVMLAAGPADVTVASTPLTAGTAYFAAVAWDAGVGQGMLADLSNLYRFWGDAIATYEVGLKDAAFPLPVSIVGLTGPGTQGYLLGLY